MPFQYNIFYRIQIGLFFPTTEMQWKEKSEHADCKSSIQGEEQKKNNLSYLLLQPPIQFPQYKAPTIRFA